MDSSVLRVRLLGQIEVSRDRQDLSRFPSRKAQGLFAFLALHRKDHAREALAHLFWPDGLSSRARKRLRTELWLIRRFLETGDGPALLRASHDRVGLDPGAGLWLDVFELERAMEPFEGRGATPSMAQVERFDAALDLYRGDLLESRYDAWAAEARECLRSRFLAAAEALLRLHRQRQAWPEAIECGRKILLHEPLSESVHRELMRCHFRMGNRPAAIRQYRRCAAELEAELEIEPMYETRALYREIKGYRGPARGLGSTALSPAEPLASGPGTFGELLPAVPNGAR